MRIPENIGLFMLSLGSWKTPMEYVTGSQRNKGRSCRKKRRSQWKKGITGDIG